VGARIGDLIEPLAELRVEIVEIAKAPAEEEVLADVAGLANLFMVRHRLLRV
jgi:hypothetical protein